MTAQLDLFGTAAPSPARRPARPDTALLLAMSGDHTRAQQSAAPPPVTPIAAPGARIDKPEGFTCTDCGIEYRSGFSIGEGEAMRCGSCHRRHTGERVPAETFAAMRQAVSCKEIAEHGRSRGSVWHGGTDWVLTSSEGGRGVEAVNGYRIEPDDGSAVPYRDWDWNTMRGDEMGGYHGMAVLVRGKPMRLVGPERTFVQGEPAAPALL